MGPFPTGRHRRVSVQLRVLDASGRTGTLSATLEQFTLVPASANDPGIQEFALVSSVSLATDPYPHTRIHLASELLNCYDRTATTVNANVGLATQGMSVSEILGSGSAADAQPAVLAQADTADVRAVADADRAPQHARGDGQPVSSGRKRPRLYQQSRIGARVYDAESDRRQHRHPVRRRRRRLDAADRAEQHPGELPDRLRAGGQCRRGLDHHADRSAAGRQRREQSAGRDRRPGRAIGRRHPRQCAAVGA